MGLAAAAAEHQYHILAVDDSIIDRKLIERLLKISSYQVTTVDSGSKALEFLGIKEEQSNHDHRVIEVNLIITDYCMPGMTGYDLLKKIKESSSLKDIPVVIMSSDNVPSRITRCLEGGAEEFFLKPVQLSDLNKLRPYILKGGKPKGISNDNPSTNANNGSNKRVAIDGDRSPERSRPRYSTASLRVV